MFLFADFDQDGSAQDASASASTQTWRDAWTCGETHHTRVYVADGSVKVDVAITLDDACRLLWLDLANLKVISTVIVRDTNLVAHRHTREMAELTLEDRARIRNLKKVHVLRLELHKRRLRQRHVLDSQQATL